MAKKRIIIPAIFDIANTQIPPVVAKKILQERVKKMSNVFVPKVKREVREEQVKKPIETNENKLAKFNFLCGG